MRLNKKPRLKHVQFGARVEPCKSGYRMRRKEEGGRKKERERGREKEGGRKRERERGREIEGEREM